MAGLLWANRVPAELLGVCASQDAALVAMTPAPAERVRVEAQSRRFQPPSGLTGGRAWH